MRAARILGLGFTTGLVLAGATTRGQAPPRGNPVPAPPPASSSVRVETAPLELIPPERFLVPVALEPVRRVSLKATADGVVQALPARLGEPVRDRQEVVGLVAAERRPAQVVAHEERLHALRQLAQPREVRGVDGLAARDRE